MFGAPDRHFERHDVGAVFGETAPLPSGKRRSAPGRESCPSHRSPIPKLLSGRRLIIGNGDEVEGRGRASTRWEREFDIHRELDVECLTAITQDLNDTLQLNCPAGDPALA